MRARESGRKVDLFIVETDSVPILGLKSFVDLEFIKLVMAIETLSRTKPTPVTRNYLNNKSVLGVQKTYSRASGFFLANAIFS